MLDVPGSMCRYTEATCSFSLAPIACVTLLLAEWLGAVSWLLLSRVDTLWRVQLADMGTWSGLERVELKTELSSISCSQFGYKHNYHSVVMTT